MSFMVIIIMLNKIIVNVLLSIWGGGAEGMVNIVLIDVCNRSPLRLINIIVSTLFYSVYVRIGA